MKKIVLLMAMFFLFGVNAYAANGDLIVNGSLGVGTSTPAEKAEINGNMVVNGTLSVGSGGVKYPDGSIQTSATKLVWDYTVPAATTSVTSPSLDGNAHGGYEFEATIINSTAVSVDHRIYYNNDTTNTHYWQYGIYSGASGPVIRNNNDAHFTENLQPGATLLMRGTIMIDPAGTVVLIMDAASTNNYRLSYNIRKVGAVANLSRVDIVASVANGIGAKSRFRLWKRL